MLKGKFFEVEEEKVIIVGFIDSCSKCRKKKFCNYFVRCFVKIREEVLVWKVYLLCIFIVIVKFDLID